MSPITRFENWRQTDPKSTLKIFFILGVVVFVGVFISLVIFANNRGSVTQTITSRSSTSFSDSFNIASQLELVDPEPVAFPSAVYFLSDGKIASLNQDYSLRIDGNDVPQSPSFIAKQIYSNEQGLIINQEFSSTIYRNGTFTNSPSNTTQITPFSSTDNLDDISSRVYVYLSQDKNILSLQQAKNIELTQEVKTLARLSVNPIYKNSEIRILNKKLYVVLYNNSAPEGIVEIWRFTGTNFQKAQTLTNVSSIKFGADKVMYSTPNQTKETIGVYQNFLIDFTQSNTGQVKLLDLNPRLIQRNILGNIFARRCDFTSDQSIICLVKQRATPIGSATDIDVLIKYNYDKDQIDYPYSGLTFSAEYVFSRGNDIYIISQENNLIYKIRN